MYCVPLTWKEQESLGHEAHLAALPGALFVCVCVCVCPSCKSDRNYDLFAGLTSR